MQRTAPTDCYAHTVAERTQSYLLSTFSAQFSLERRPTLPGGQEDCRSSNAAHYIQRMAAHHFGYVEKEFTLILQRKKAIGRITKAPS